MDISPTLAQLLGLYFLIVGSIEIYRKKSIMPALNQLAANRPLLLILALIELMAGLAVVLTNPDLTLDANGLISLIGWMLLVESILYLALPYKRLQKLIKSFNTARWHGIGGVLAVIAGLYLCAVGFGFIA